MYKLLSPILLLLGVLCSAAALFQTSLALALFAVVFYGIGMAPKLPKIRLPILNLPTLLREKPKQSMQNIAKEMIVERSKQKEEIFPGDALGVQGNRPASSMDSSNGAAPTINVHVTVKAPDNQSSGTASTQGLLENNSTDNLRLLG